MVDQVKTFFKKLYSENLNFWSKTVETAIQPFHGQTLKKEQGLFAPIIFIVAVLWTILTVGIAIGSLFTLFGSLLVLYFIITRIFGIDVNLSEVVVV